MTQIKSGYITGSNQQLQAIRPFLVAEGFVDDKIWNEHRFQMEPVIRRAIMIEHTLIFSIYDEWVCDSSASPCLYTLSPDEDLEKAAKIIKEKFYDTNYTEKVSH